MKVRLLSLRGFARRRGLAYGTVLRYRKEGRLPEPDGELTDDLDGDLPESEVHSYPGWFPETADNWQRPGQGARTDLKRPDQSSTTGGHQTPDPDPAKPDKKTP